VRVEAVRALASIPVPEDLPLLRELLKDENPALRAEAVRTLAGFSRPEDLPLLRELAIAPDDNVAVAAVRGLILLCSLEEVEGFSEPMRPGAVWRGFGCFGRSALYAGVAQGKRQVRREVASQFRITLKHPVGVS
jgi:HEAT repeats